MTTACQNTTLKNNELFGENEWTNSDHSWIN